MSQTIDLSKIKDRPKIISEIDPKEIAKEIAKEVIDEMGGDFTIGESDPLMVLIEVFAQREARLRQRINYASSQNNLAFAEKENLENLVALLGIEREGREDPELRQAAIDSLDLQSTAGSFSGYKAFVSRGRESQVVDCNPYHEGLGVVKVPCLFDDQLYFETKLGEPDGKGIRRLVKDTVKPEEAEMIRSAIDLERSTLLEKIQKDINDFRPLTDKATATEVSFVDYEVRASLLIKRGSDSTIVLGEARQKAERILSELKRIGHVIPMSLLYSALHTDDVLEVVIESPQGEINPLKPEEWEASEEERNRILSNRLRWSVPRLTVLTVTEAPQKNTGGS